MTFGLPSKILSGLKIYKSLYDIKFLGKRIPLYCEWEITNYCNMSCTFCSTYTNDRNAAKNITIEEAFSLLDQLADMGTRIIHFSGGEPTLWKGLPELIARAKDKGMLVSMTTNGSSSLERIEKFLRLDLIRVSLDGTEQFHDSVRQFSGAYQKGIETLRFLRSKGKKPIITAVYMDSTPYEMMENLAKTAQELNVQLSLNIHGNSHEEIGNPETSWSKNGLYSKYISMLNKLRAKYGNVISNPEPYLSVVKLGGLDKYGCRAMDIAIAIGADGTVCLPCTRMPKLQMKGNLREIYYGEQIDEIRKLQGRDPLCEGCGMRCMSSASALLQLKGQASIINAYAKVLM